MQMADEMETWVIAVVCVAVVLMAVIYAFKDKIPILKHLPEVTCGWCCGFGCMPADYMEDDEKPTPEAVEAGQADLKPTNERLAA